MILTVDVGTSTTKAAVWDQGGLVAMASTPIDTSHPSPGWAEQRPSDWWDSVVEACSRLGELAPDALGSVDVVGCTGARQTLTLVDAKGEPLGPGILWSDRRAAAEADELARALGDQSERSGILLDAGSVAAKIAWLATHEQERFAASTWILTPRDLVIWRLTGSVATDATMASRSGLYHLDGQVDLDLAGVAGSKLAPVVSPDCVIGGLGGQASAALGLTAGTPVVIGSGDRACEVLGTGATEACPMVSWGTTANVSVPVGIRPVLPTPGVVVSKAADGGYLLEGGLSAAGSFLAWLGRLTGHPSGELAARALDSPPGARGVSATPWLEGARAPWWDPDAGASFVGLASAHGLADVARAVFESVAWEVGRCLEAIAARSPMGPPVTGLALGGSGATVPVWSDVLTGITGLPVTCRRSGQAASAGAAMLAAGAVGLDFDLDAVDPVETRVAPDPAVVERYFELRARAEAVAAAVIGLPRESP